MSTTRIQCHNEASFSRRNEPVSLGVPFVQGALSGQTTATLTDSSGQPLPVQTQPLAYWPDGSVKWLLCDFLADLPAEADAVFRLQPATVVAKGSSGFRVEQSADRWLIATGAARFEVDARILRPFRSVLDKDNRSVAGPMEMLVGDGEDNWIPHIDRLTLEACGAVRCTLAITGGCRQGAKELVRFEARLHFFAGSARCRLELRLHNPKAATHPGNLWDLGDPASEL
jgi:hypothetical protein